MPDAVRYLGLKDTEIFFCLKQNFLLHTFNTKTGAASYKPIHDMGAAFRWKVEAPGTDGQPVTICEC